MARAVVAILLLAAICEALPSAHHPVRSKSTSRSKLKQARRREDEELAKKVVELGKKKNSSNGSAEGPELLNNNLGGLGPDTDSHFMSVVFGNVAQLQKDSTPITMVLLNLTEYQPGQIALNGLGNDIFPSVNVLSDTNVTLRAVLVSSMTGERIKLSKFVISALNLDCNDDSTGTQQIIVSGFSSYKVSDSTSLKVEKMSDGSTSFMATTMSEAHEAPADPLLESPTQLAGTVALVFEDVDEFEMTLQVKGKADVSEYGSGRNFYFTGVSQVMVGDANATDVWAGYSGVQETSADVPGGGGRGGSSFISLLVTLSMLCCFCMCCGWLVALCVGTEIRFLGLKVDFHSNGHNAHHHGHGTL